MENQFMRTAKLIGTEGIETLQSKTVAVFGLGGVGGYTVEALVRAGVGQLILIDFDTVEETNLNRQLIALHTTLGELKTSLFEKRLHDINPNIKVVALNMVYNREKNAMLDDLHLDFVVDAIDMVSSKLDLIAYCYANNIPLISSMGTANRIRPERLQISTIEKTSGCGLARVMRKELKARGITGVPVVYSSEEAIAPLQFESDKSSVRRSVPGSISFVPPTAGMYLASYVVRRLLNISD